MVPLKRLAELRVDCASTGERPYVALEHIVSWEGSLIDGIDLPVRTHCETGMASVEPGDVLFGKLRPYLAKIWVVDRPALASTELMCLRPRPGVDSRWLGYLTNASPFVGWAVATSEGTKMPRTSWEKVGGFRAWVPSNAEQQRIADYLDIETARIDALISKKRRMIEVVEERLKFVARSFTTAHGKVAPLRRFARAVKTGTTPPANALKELRGSEIGWYSPGDVGASLRMLAPARRLSKRAVSEGWVPKFPPDSTLVIGIGATAGRVCHNVEASTGNQQMTCITPNARVVPRFLSWQLWARAEELRATAPYTTLPIINNDFLRSVLIVVPALHLQQEVVDRIDQLANRLLTTTDRIQGQIDLLTERRQALITAAVTGELTIPRSGGVTSVDKPASEVRLAFEVWKSHLDA